MIVFYISDCFRFIMIVDDVSVTLMSASYGTGLVFVKRKSSAEERNLVGLHSATFFSPSLYNVCSIQGILKMWWECEVTLFLHLFGRGV